jgi:hypothetical protein
MSQVRWTLFLLTLPALSPAARATLTDHYTMQVDSVQSQVQYEIDTNLGLCTLSPSANGNISGDMVVVLHPGAYPVSDGQFDGGNCSCMPNLVGIIPNSLPGLPPLLEVHLSSLVVRPHSLPFQCDSNGLFLAYTSCDVTNGNLDVSVSGVPFIPVSILGLTSDTTRSHGHVWIDGSGIHVLREIGNVIEVNVPALNLSLHIAIRGVIRGNMGFPVPTRFCTATPNSTGQPASIDFSGSPSVSLNDGQLLVTHCPPNVTGLFITSDQQGQLPFGNGYRCATGQLLRIGAIHVGSNGAGTLALDVHAPPASGNLVAGSRWNFQCAYRDVAAGGALFNASDAIAVDFVP